MSSIPNGSKPLRFGNASLCENIATHASRCGYAAWRDNGMYQVAYAFIYLRAQRVRATVWIGGSEE